MTDPRKAIEDFLNVPLVDPRLCEKAEEAMESLRTAVGDDKMLRDYRQIEKELGSRQQYTFEPPNFPYVVHSS